MSNYFNDNADLVFQFENLHLEEIVDLIEDGYMQAKTYDYAPRNYTDAIENYRKILEIVGDIAANFIAPRAGVVDEEGNMIKNGKVVYSKSLQENLKQLSDAELMAVEFPRKYGGLNFPKSKSAEALIESGVALKLQTTASATSVVPSTYGLLVTTTTLWPAFFNFFASSSLLPPFTIRAK